MLTAFGLLFALVIGMVVVATMSDLVGELTVTGGLADLTNAIPTLFLFFLGAVAVAMVAGLVGYFMTRS